MRNGLIVKPSVLLMIFILAEALFLCDFFSIQASDPARIVNYSGDVVLLRRDEKISPSIDLVLKANDTIRTGTGSFVEVSYDDRLANVVRVEENSKVVLDCVSLTKNTRVSMDRGELILKLKKLKEGSQFKVHTPVAIAGARGTGFSVSLNTDGAVMKCYKSAIYIREVRGDGADTAPEITVHEGWKMAVTGHGSPLCPERLERPERHRWDRWLADVRHLMKERAMLSTSFTRLARARCLSLDFEESGIMKKDLVTLLKVDAMRMGLPVGM